MARKAIATRGPLGVYGADGRVAIELAGSGKLLLTRDELFWLLSCGVPAAIYALGEEGEDRRGAFERISPEQKDESCQASDRSNQLGSTDKLFR